jgi:hypothetical protein
MKINNLKFPLVTLPDEVGLTLFLIGEELKSRKFFDGLRNLDLAGCYYQPHLEKLILVSVGLDEESDENIDFYCALIAHHCQKIETDSETITHQAFNVYIELMIEKKRRLEQKVSDL